MNKTIYTELRASFGGRVSLNFVMQKVVNREQQVTLNLKQALGPKFKSGGGGIAARFGTGHLMVPAGGNTNALNMSSADLSFDNPANTSGISRGHLDASSHNLSMMSDANVT